MYSFIDRYGGFFYYKENGEFKKTKCKPKLYIKTNKETKFKSIFGDYLDEIKFNSYYDSREWIKEYKHVENFEIFGNQDPLCSFIDDKFPNEIQWDIDNINTAFIDIEVLSEEGFPHARYANYPITGITVELNGKYHVFHESGRWSKNNSPDDAYDINLKNIKTYPYKDEQDLLYKFLEFWQKAKVDIITGWNSTGFDVPYLINRISKVLSDYDKNRLSPLHGIVHDKFLFKEREVGNDIIFDIAGLTQYDYIDLYKKFTYVKRESYKLDHIAYVELNYSKLDYSEYSNLGEMYRQNYQKYIDYNIRDVEIVKKLDDKIGLISLGLTLTYMCKVRHCDVFQQTKMWDALIENKLRETNRITIPKKFKGKGEKFEGAYVQHPKTGFHKWVVSFDLTSLYPHLIMQYNISPETLVERNFDFSIDTAINHYKNDELITPRELKANNKTVAGNGVTFTKESRGILPELMQSLFEERKKHKKLMLEAEEKLTTCDENEKEKWVKKQAYHKVFNMGLKVSLNSAFGAMGNEFFRYFDVDIAEAITNSGQLSLKWIQVALNDYLNKILKTDDVDYCVYGDTDSVVGETILNTSIGNITIEELYKKFATDENLVDKRDRDDYIHDISNNKITSLSIDNNLNLIDDNILYIMKHDVEKEMFRIELNENHYVDVTEDHSIIVLYENDIISVTPKELNEDMEIIYINHET